jgi:hypothetical protein
MFLHDCSDIPLDFLRLFSALNWKVGQLIFFPITLIGWIYWRLWFLPMTVMRSIAFDSASLLFDLPCGAGECTWEKFPIESMRERVPFLLLLGSLLYLHLLWFLLLLKKGYREIFSGKKEDKKD